MLSHATQHKLTDARGDAVTLQEIIPVDPSRGVFQVLATTTDATLTEDGLVCTHDPEPVSLDPTPIRSVGCEFIAGYGLYHYDDSSQFL
jgi:hypothetical protein